jgi:hypothetical protein
LIKRFEHRRDHLDEREYSLTSDQRGGGIDQVTV